MRTRVCAALVTAVLLQGCKPAVAARGRGSDAELLHGAVSSLSSVIVYDIFSPPQASRAYAYSSIAAYETLRQGHPGYRTLAGQVNGLTPVPAPDSGVTYDYSLAGVHAFMTVGKALTFSRGRMDSLRTAMDAEIRRTGVPRSVYDRSIAYGERVADHILAWSRQDHFLQTRGMSKYTVTSERGRWVPTPPAYMDAVEPNWGRLRPFVMDSASQFKPAPPFPFDTAKGSAFFQQAKEVYDTRQALTEEHRDITAFWDCNPYVMHVQGHAMFATKKITPGGHWMSIVSIAARQSGADVMKSAEAYVRTSIVLADGFISSWDEKFRSNVIRPETVINAYIDEQWEPMLQTPPFPEYTSGHSVISTAAAVILTDEFGKVFRFRDTSEVAYGLPVRTFGSFEQAAAEAAISRLYGGIHYQRSIEQGAIQGRNVGGLVLQRLQTRADSGPRIAAAGAPARRGIER